MILTHGGVVRIECIMKVKPFQRDLVHLSVQQLLLLVVLLIGVPSQAYLEAWVWMQIIYLGGEPRKCQQGCGEVR